MTALVKDAAVFFALGVRQGSGQLARERCVRVGKWVEKERKWRQEMVDAEEGVMARERCVRFGRRGRVIAGVLEQDDDGASQDSCRSSRVGGSGFMVFVGKRKSVSSRSLRERPKEPVRSRSESSSFTICWVGVAGGLSSPSASSVSAVGQGSRMARKSDMDTPLLCHLAKYPISAALRCDGNSNR